MMKATIIVYVVSMGLNIVIERDATSPRDCLSVMGRMLLSLQSADVTHEVRAAECRDATADTPVVFAPSINPRFVSPPASVATTTVAPSSVEEERPRAKRKRYWKRYKRSYKRWSRKRRR